MNQLRDIDKDKVAEYMDELMRNCVTQCQQPPQFLIDGQARFTATRKRYQKLPPLQRYKPPVFAR